MGWADALIMMDIPYDSDDALDQIDRIGSGLYKIAHEEGERFRNSTVTCIAPTGTISYLANCSSGIEPNYTWRYSRESDEGKEVIEHPLYNSHVRGTIHESQTALNIKPIWHLKHQATWQKYVDLAVSKTINLPNSATVQDVLDIYRQARDMGVKGITVYRDGSKDKQVLRAVDRENKPVNVPSSNDRHGITYERNSGCGILYLTANDNGNKPWETFVRTAGGCEANNEAMGRLISGWLQDGGDPHRIARVLRKVKCINAMKSAKSDGKSCADIIGQCIDSKWNGKATSKDAKLVCPDCGATLAFGRGCAQGTCEECGWSGCS